MTTKAFIDKLNKTITIEGQNLMTEFFITFSRFECALKTSNFVNGDNERVMANWDTFIASIRPDFDKNKTDKLKKAVDYILQNPPRIQIINNGEIGWRDRHFQNNEHEINRLGLSIRDIRNNLFHGGKFNGVYEEDVSRNFILLKGAIIILDEWLSLNITVKNNYLQPIS